MNEHIQALVIFLLLVIVPATAAKAPDTDKTGKIVVLVTWGDDNNTPATDVYVEAHGFIHQSEKSFVLERVKPGVYEGSLPPGVYDVFLSEGTSEPRCRRMLVKEGLTTRWTLKFEIDEIYTQH